MAVLWSCLCSTEEAISYWLPCLVNQFEIEYEARKTLIIGMVMIFMHDHHDIDDHHDDKQGTLWFLSSTLVRCRPAQSFIQFWGENCLRLLRLGAIDDYQTPSNISPPCHLWRGAGGGGCLIFNRSKKTLIFYIFISAFLKLCFKTVDAYQTPSNISPPLERARWRRTSDIFEGKMIQSDFNSVIIASDYQDK